METNKGAFLRIMMRLERREIQKMGPHKNDDEAIQEGAQRKRDQTMGTLLRMPMRLVGRVNKAKSLLIVLMRLVKREGKKRSLLIVSMRLVMME
jgi:hypothetical protein